MWQAKECSNCQNEVIVKVGEVDVFCDKCEELVSLRIKVEEQQKEIVQLKKQLESETERATGWYIESRKLKEENEKWKKAYHKLDPVGFTFNEPLK